MSRTTAIFPLRVARPRALVCALPLLVGPGASALVASLPSGPLAAHSVRRAAPQVATPDPAALLKAAGSARPARRSDAWTELAGLDPGLVTDGQRAELVALAQEQLEDAAARAANDALQSDLQALGRRRAELDRAREEALRLIQDEERYFYPFKAHDTTVERARLYPPVQQEVEERVRAVREIWESDESVVVPRKTLVLALDLASVHAACRHLELEVPSLADVPAWVLRVARAGEWVSVQNYAWTPEQSRVLDYDLEVMASNEAFWAKLDQRADELGDEPWFPREIERDSVRLTNAYRRMLGVPVLAWSPSLQVACRAHSNYMAEARLLTHEGPPPRRATLSMRMRAAGYLWGKNENIFFGAGGALAAHHKWVGSSGHHRGLVDPDARAVASAEAFGYWAQETGTRANIDERERLLEDHGTTDR